MHLWVKHFQMDYISVENMLTLMLWPHDPAWDMVFHKQSLFICVYVFAFGTHLILPLVWHGSELNLSPPSVEDTYH